MSVEEEQQLQSSCDNTQQLEEEEQQSAGHKKPLSDKDRETMAYNHCTTLINVPVPAVSLAAHHAASCSGVVALA